MKAVHRCCMTLFNVHTIIMYTHHFCGRQLGANSSEATQLCQKTPTSNSLIFPIAHHLSKRTYIPLHFCFQFTRTFIYKRVDLLLNRIMWRIDHVTSWPDTDRMTRFRNYWPVVVNGIAIQRGINIVNPWTSSGKMRFFTCRPVKAVEYFKRYSVGVTTLVRSQTQQIY